MIIMVICFIYDYRTQDTIFLIPCKLYWYLLYLYKYEYEHQLIIIYYHSDLS